ncbi:unnamed protein product [Amoebophrya sp. A120]|nr:unnamed protein product [Amoebophrya sp. A120]|eukprot:GSA120T00025653001.1
MFSFSLDGKGAKPTGLNSTGASTTSTSGSSFKPLSASPLRAPTLTGAFRQSPPAPKSTVGPLIPPTSTTSTYINPTYIPAPASQLPGAPPAHVLLTNGGGAVSSHQQLSRVNKNSTRVSSAGSASNGKMNHSTAGSSTSGGTVRTTVSTTLPAGSTFPPPPVQLHSVADGTSSSHGGSTSSRSATAGRRSGDPAPSVSSSHTQAGGPPVNKQVLHDARAGAPAVDLHDLPSVTRRGSQPAPVQLTAGGAVDTTEGNKEELQPSGEVAQKLSSTSSGGTTNKNGETPGTLEKSGKMNTAQDETSTNSRGAAVEPVDEQRTLRTKPTTLFTPASGTTATTGAGKNAPDGGVLPGQVLDTGPTTSATTSTPENVSPPQRSSATRAKATATTAATAPVEHGGSTVDPVPPLLSSSTATPIPGFDARASPDHGLRPGDKVIFSEVITSSSPDQRRHSATLFRVDGECFESREAMMEYMKNNQQSTKRVIGEYYTGTSEGGRGAAGSSSAGSTTNSAGVSSTAAVSYQCPLCGKGDATNGTSEQPTNPVEFPTREEFLKHMGEMHENKVTTRLLEGDEVVDDSGEVLTPRRAEEARQKLSQRKSELGPSGELQSSPATRNGEEEAAHQASMQIVTQTNPETGDTRTILRDAETGRIEAAFDEDTAEFLLEDKHTASCKNTAVGTTTTPAQGSCTSPTSKVSANIKSKAKSKPKAPTLSEEQEKYLQELSLLAFRALVQDMGKRLLKQSKSFHEKKRRKESEAVRQAMEFFGLKEEGATAQEANAAYKKKAREMHPDKCGGTDEAKQAFQEMKALYDMVKSTLEGAGSGSGSKAVGEDESQSPDRAQPEGRQKEAYDEDSPPQGKRDQDEAAKAISYDPSSRDSMREALERMLAQIRNARRQSEDLDK